MSLIIVNCSRASLKGIDVIRAKPNTVGIKAPDNHDGEQRCLDAVAVEIMLYV